MLTNSQVKGKFEPGGPDRVVRQVSTSGNVGTPTVSGDVKEEDCRVPLAGDNAIILSSLTSYEVRKDINTRTREEEPKAKADEKAACEGGNEVAPGQGPLLCAGSPTQPHHKEGSRKQRGETIPNRKTEIAIFRTELPLSCVQNGKPSQDILPILNSINSDS